MEIGDTLEVAGRAEWRHWLASNYQTAPEVWLVSPKKTTGRPALPYNDAVEEALCFGWIDSIRKGFGDDATAQRFSPRTRGSTYSQTNIERLRRLSELGQLMPEVAEDVAGVLATPYLFPDDIMTVLRANPTAWENFQRFSAPYQRIRIAYIDHARSRPEEFQKRLDNFLRKTEAGKQFGYGIESYY